MSSHNFEPRVELEIRPQPLWLWCLLAIHVLAAMAISVLAIGIAVRVVLAVGIVLSLSRQWAVHGKRTAPRAIRSLVWQSDGRWRLIDGRGTTVGILEDYYLGSRLVILKFRHHPAVLLWNGGVLSTPLRRLRTRLRHGEIVPAGSRT
ncbi:MAG TPA: hypothetical protein VFK96_02140 [Gammaproteobacteria bacterium]|jgi:hypothetical protein|nr:hypothetical protein [Gammaproteobacteria bacterium]